MYKMKLLFSIIIFSAVITCANAADTKIVGKWVLLSDDIYLSMKFTKNGYVTLTRGQKTGPLAGSIGIWTLNNGSLIIKDETEVLFIFSNIVSNNNNIYATNKSNVIMHFKFMP